MLTLPIPYLPTLDIRLDDAVAFCVSILLAVTVNAEGQAFAATFFGDKRENSKDRLHFNAFLHLNVWGTLCFFIAGFGWAKEVSIDPIKFSKPRLHTAFSRLAGPIANFLLANIAASVVWLMNRYELHDRVFTMVMIVNLTTAVYHILPIPPLAGAAILQSIFPNSDERFFKFFKQFGYLILIGIFLAEKLTGYTILSDLMNPAVILAYQFVTGQSNPINNLY